MLIFVVCMTFEEFVLGQPITILLGFNNKGDQAFNITGIGAHLQHPFDYSHYIQNVRMRLIASPLFSHAC